MARALIFPILCLALAVAGAPARAGEAGAAPQLVVGRADLGMTDQQIPLYGSNSLSVGTLATRPGNDRLALGGYVDYAVTDFRLSSSWRNADTGMAANLAAIYSGPLVGQNDSAALKLGYDWGHAFSPNANQPGITAVEPLQPSLSLTLSWRHDVTPAVSLDGFAAASRSSTPEDLNQPDIHVGAGLGVKF